MNFLYKSPEWKSLDEIDRAQLLLVIEGLKKGTIINGNWNIIPRILKRSGLEFALMDKDIKNPIFLISRKKNLLEAIDKFGSLSENSDKSEYDNINGWILGYPECCIIEYNRERTPEQNAAQKMGINHLTYKFGQELDALLKSGKPYPDFLDYCPPTFTPCGVYCPEAEKLLTSWKDAIETLDSKAGEDLVRFNRNNSY